MLRLRRKIYDYRFEITFCHLDQLAQAYIHHGIIPAKYEDDALHIAAASVNGCNIVVSWNFKHMVRAKTIFGVNGINKMLGYGELEILSPDSMVDEEDDK